MQNSQINYWFVGALVAMSLSASIVLLGVVAVIR
jgi:hypothetical protein